MIEGISAVTLGTHEMPRAVRFYRALRKPAGQSGDSIGQRASENGPSACWPPGPSCSGRRRSAVASGH